jgi:hypothetical protein
MPTKKNKGLPPNFTEMFEATKALQKCIEIKCKKEEEQLKKNKYVIEQEKLIKNFHNNIEKNVNRYKNDKVKGELEFQKFFFKYNEAYTNLEIKIIKEKYRNDFLNCQLKGCYNESLLRFNFTIDNLLFYSNKNTEIYKLASKYKNKFDETKLTVEDINTFDSDKKKIELNKIISEFKNNMIKLKNKLNKRDNI